MSSTDKPAFIYKIVPYDSPVPALPDLPKVLPVSDLDSSSGFIHLSTSRQVLGTLKHFFGGGNEAEHPKVYILRLPYAPLEEAKLIKWESPDAKVCGDRPDEGLFAHLYNGLKLGKEEVDYVGVLEKNKDGKWEGAVEGAGKDWMIF